MEFTYDGGGVGQGGTVTLFCDGNAVGSGRVERTAGVPVLRDETCDVGDKYGSPMTTYYTQTKTPGDIEWVKINLRLDDHNHLIKPEDPINLAIGIQSVWPNTRGRCPHRARRARRPPR